MDFRTSRQLAVLGVVALVVTGIGLLIVRVNLPEPTCNDRILNRGEEEADCGGPCIPCAYRYRKPLEVFWVRFVKTRENSYDVAAEIHNPNVKLGAATFPYEVRLYDTAGALVDWRRGRSFLYPAEVMHVVEVGLTSGRVIRNAEIRLGDPNWVLTDAIGPDVIAGNREYAIVDDLGSRRSVLKALLTNRTLEDIRNLAVGVLMFDERGTLTGVHRTVLDELRAQSTAPVTFTWPQVVAESVSTILVEVRSAAKLPAPVP